MSTTEERDLAILHAAGVLYACFTHMPLLRSKDRLIGFLHLVRTEPSNISSPKEPCFTATFFDKTLIESGYGVEMLSWYEEREHVLNRDDIASVLDDCNRVFVRDGSLSVNKRVFSLMVDPGKGSWVVSPWGNT